MTELTKSGSRWERTLAATSGRSLLIVFWAFFLIAGLGAAMPAPLSTVVGGVAQLVLAVIWIGYPIVLFHCFAEIKTRSIGVPLMACGVILGYGLSVFVYSKGGELARSTVAPVLGATLILAPFVTGAYALKHGERKAKVLPGANVIATALALFAFPFFGAYIHERFRRAYFSERETSH